MPEEMTEEQVKELQEKVKNMSPEELKEFQKKQCIFCQIISGKVQSKKIYEDDKTIAVLDINPANPGHILLLPKEHYSIMPQLPPDELQHIFKVAKSLSNMALKSLEASGTNILVANGPAAGQKAQHFMVHIIPRKEGDNLKFDLPQKKINEKDLNVIQKKLADKMEKLSGIKMESPIQVEAQPNIVEAEFKEETSGPKAPPPVVEEPIAEPTIEEEPESEEEPKIETKNEEKAKKVKKKKPKKSQKTEPKEEEEEPSNIDLDSIAGVLGIK